MAPTTQLKRKGGSSGGHLKKRKDVKSIASNAKMLMQVILHTVECCDHVFFGYLSYHGKREGEGYYTKPLEDAYNTTILNNIDGHPSPLYPDIKNKSMTDLFKFNYFAPRRETKGKLIYTILSYTLLTYFTYYIV